jgi:alpha-L-rhamnosidase
LQAAEVANLRCEYLKNPLGIDVFKPRLSWVIEEGGQKIKDRGQKQTAYQVLVASSEKLLKNDNGDLWDSGKLLSDQSIQVEYAGKPMQSRMACFWKVRVWEKEGKASAWSQPASWSMGLLQPNDWQAKWIGFIGKDTNSTAALYLRKEFHPAKPIKRATAFVCGLGFFDLFLNGSKVSDHVMDPALSTYDKRCFYVTFDITQKLKVGANAVGIILGNGRYFGATRGRTFGRPKLLLQIELEYADGTFTRVISDESWRATDLGPIRLNNEYDGELYDARKEMKDWAGAGFDAKAWSSAILVGATESILQAQMIEPMRVTERLKPVSVTRSPRPDVWLVDFGQNFYGTVCLRVKGSAGTQLRLLSAYSLNADSNLRTADNRRAKCTDSYVLKGGGTEEWHPRFRGQGFRRVEISGFPGTPTVENFEGLVIHTDVASVGSFECSNALINRIHGNLRWGFRAFLRSVPMDPDRDERQGWNGDPAKDSESEAWNFQVAALYNKWIDDHRYDQRTNGQLPQVTPTYQQWWIPDVLWPSTMTLIPEMILNYYADTRIIERNFDAMKGFVDYGQTLKNAKGFIPVCAFGDWCYVSCIGSVTNRIRLDRFGKKLRWDFGATDGGLLATAYQFNNERLLAGFARLLGRPEEFACYLVRAAQTKEAFNREFLDPTTGAYIGGTQCAQVVPLAFGMVPEQNRSKVVAALVDDIMIKREGHLSVGLIGIQWLMQVLSDAGHSDVAYILATQTTQPSWGYMVGKGSTTSWERWDTDTGDPGMNSEMLLILSGNLDTWFYQTLAGINANAAHPGFKHFTIAPKLVGDLTWVNAHFDSPYGRIVSNWKRELNKLTMEVIIPPNTSATVYVPVKDTEVITESGKPVGKAKGVKFLRMENGAAVYTLDSGAYQFQSTLSENNNLTNNEN